MRYLSTRGDATPRRFCEILLEGLAPDGGLYLPQAYPRVDAATLQRWRNLSYPALAFELLSLYIDDIPAPDLRRLVTYYDNPTEDEARSERLRLIRLRNGALLHLLFSSGARISEALSLDVGDVCRDRRMLSRVTLEGKGRREGAIFVRRHADLKGIQTWTDGGRTFTRACAGTIKRPLRVFLPGGKK